MKTQLKLTHQVLNDLKLKAEALPPYPLIKNGIMSVVGKTEKLTGAELLQKYPKEFKQDAHKVVLHKRYIVKNKIPVYVNHYVRLQQAYRNGGEQAVINYQKQVNDYHAIKSELIKQIQLQETN